MPTASGHTTAIRASKVKGTTVYNTSGDKIGHVEDVILDKESDRILFAALGFGGIGIVGQRAARECLHAEVQNGRQGGVAARTAMMDPSVVAIGGRHGRTFSRLTGGALPAPQPASRGTRARSGER